VSLAEALLLKKAAKGQDNYRRDRWKAAKGQDNYRRDRWKLFSISIETIGRSA